MSGDIAMVSRAMAEPTLTEAAEALEAELRRFDELALAVQREKLTSEKGLRRAAQKLGELASADTRLGERLQALVAAIGAARERQQAQAEAVHARAEEIQRRTDVLASLLGQWAALGRDAAEVNKVAQSLVTDDEGENGSTRRALDPTRFEEVDDRLGRLADDAQRLADAAKDAGFPDVADQGTSLRAQLLAALNKVRLLRERAPKPKA